MVEQDARVSANFTQKRQEKNCNTFVGKKGVQVFFVIYFYMYTEEGERRDERVEAPASHINTVCSVSNIMMGRKAGQKDGIFGYSDAWGMRD